MSSFGKHPLLTFINGSTSEPLDADNMNEIERVVEDCDNEFARSSDFKFKEFKEYFYNRNCKEINTFDDSADWTAESSSSLSNDTANKFIGNQSLKTSETDNSSGYCGANITLGSTLDLTKFNDGSASNTSDCIAYCFFCSEYAKIDFVGFELGTDSSNYYYVAYGSNNWSRNTNVVLFPRKSAFSSVGSPDWSTINWIRVYFHTTATASGEYITSHLLSLYRQDPENVGYYNPFQIYRGASTGWENTLDNIVAGWLLYKDTVTNDIAAIYGNWYNFSGNETELHIYCTIINFIFSGSFACKYQGESPSITWYSDSSNFIECFLQGGTMYLNATESGILTQTTQALTNNIAYNEQFNIKIEKNFQTIRFIFYKGYEQQQILEYETSISASSDGCVFLGHSGTVGPSPVYDFWVTSNPNNILNFFNDKTIKIKQNDETVNASTTFQDDNDLQINLPEGIFEVNLKMTLDAQSAIPDFKFQYDVSSDIELISQRFIKGAALGVSDLYDTNMRFVSESSFTSSVAVGLTATGNAIVEDTFIVKVGKLGAYIHLQWAQNTSNASNCVMKTGSYLKFSRINLI